MLKIKDEVNLKELEKFGFEYRYGFYQKATEFINYCIFPNYEPSRTIQINTYDDDDCVLDDTLYDLIQAGLIEKVEG